MAYYLVHARLKPELEEELRTRLAHGEFEPLRPFGPTLSRSLREARRDPATGAAVWEEEDYCRPPLAQEREAVLDRYFDDLRVERVGENEGWERITGLSSLWGERGGNHQTRE